MTLTEYLSQENPKRFPRVILTEDECIIHAANEKGSLVTVPLLWKMYKIGRPYFIHKGSTLLWTTDDFGNPHKISCFEFGMSDV
jgi:hypothetical protein